MFFLVKCLLFSLLFFLVVCLPAWLSIGCTTERLWPVGAARWGPSIGQSGHPFRRGDPPALPLPPPWLHHTGGWNHMTAKQLPREHISYVPIQGQHFSMALLFDWYSSTAKAVPFRRNAECRNVSGLVKDLMGGFFAIQHIPKFIATICHSSSHVQHDCLLSHVCLHCSSVASDVMFSCFHFVQDVLYFDMYFVPGGVPVRAERELPVAWSITP